MVRHPSLLRAITLALSLGGPAAFAAGGHFAIDDAGILGPGECELETWAARTSASERLVHAGLSCRAGPVEVGAATEPHRLPGVTWADHSVQLKWAAEFAPGWSGGVSAQRGWQIHARPRYQGTAVVGLLSWSPHEDLRLHANLGRELAHSATDHDRGGLNAEWTPGGGAWTLVAERFREARTHFARGGLRWTPDDSWAVDLSRSTALRGTAVSAWTLGISRRLGR